MIADSMIHSQLFFLWGQQGGGGELIGLIIFVLIIVFNAFKAMFEARFAEAEEKKRKELVQSDILSLELGDDPTVVPVKPQRRERKRTSPNRMGTAGSGGSEDMTGSQRKRGPLSRELGTQGEGSRFEADPGTFDAAQLVAPSIEPTVRPTLESMTGIYDAAPTITELGDQPLTLDIQKLIARPEGIRQAVILAEILKRPDF